MPSMKELILEKLNSSVATLRKVMADDALLKALADAAEITGKAMLNGHKLMVAGNGGSAADSQHLVAEFVSRLTIDRPAMRAIALTTDSSILTAIGNDYGYSHVFSRQIEALGQAGDVFLGISTSGNSENILKALELSRKLGITTIGFSGRMGGKMPPLCDYNVVIPSEIAANIQESHLALEHVYCHLVEIAYFGKKFFDTSSNTPLQGVAVRRH
jgi:D-sedoheptulose 7-phosphate isomerase